MRILVAILTIVSGLWFGYWFIGSTAKETVIRAWLEDRAEAGWTVEYSDFSVIGFPNRFDSRFKDLRLGDPRSGVIWSAPEFQILALSYKPNHIIAVWPERQSLSLNGEEITITNSQMRASVLFEPDTKLAIAETALRTKDLVLKGARGWQISMEAMDFSTRQSPSRPLAHDIVFTSKNLIPTEGFRRRMDPSGALPEVVETLIVDLQLGFDAPWDRIAVESGLPQVTAISVNNIKASWGLLDVQAKGDLLVDRRGILQGDIELTVKDWRGVLGLLVKSGVIGQSLADTLESGLGLLTSLSNSPNDVTAPLRFSGGQWSLGPIPLGAAPRLRR